MTRMLSGVDHHLERARIEEVADQHTGGIAKERIGGRAAAPQVGFVDNVIVQQRRRVDEFDHGGKLQRARAAVAECAGDKQQHSRPKPLAAGADDVLGDLD